MINTALARRAVLPTITVLIFGLAVYALSGLLKEIRISDVLASLENVSILKVVAAFAFTAGSYFMLTHYDRLALKGIGRTLPYTHVARTSFTAFGISHTAGLGSISGGSIRYRSYFHDGLTALEITGIMTLIALNYFLGVATLLGISLTIDAKQLSFALPLTVGGTQVAGLILLFMVVTYLTLAYFIHKPIRIGKKIIPMPGLRLSLAQLLVSCADLGCSAGALYILLPPKLAIGYLPFLGIYAMAIQAGVLSNVPGGLGVFESILFFLLPGTPSDALLSAVLLYRVIYYIVPFVLALGLLTGREAMHKHGHLRQLAMWIKSRLYRLKSP